MLQDLCTGLGEVLERLFSAAVVSTAIILPQGWISENVDKVYDFAKNVFEVAKKLKKDKDKQNKLFEQDDEDDEE